MVFAALCARLATLGRRAARDRRGAGQFPDERNIEREAP